MLVGERMSVVLDVEKLPPVVLAELKHQAEKNGRTVEVEAVARLVPLIDRGPAPIAQQTDHVAEEECAG